MKNDVFSEKYTKLVMYDTRTKKELAVITEKEITTAVTEIVVRLTPRYD